MGFFPEGKSGDGIELLPFIPFLQNYDRFKLKHSAFGVPMDTRKRPCRQPCTTGDFHPPRETWICCATPVQLAGLAKKVLVVQVLKPISAQEIAEKNWTRKEVFDGPKTLIREALEDETKW